MNPPAPQHHPCDELVVLFQDLFDRLPVALAEASHPERVEVKLTDVPQVGVGPLQILEDHRCVVVVSRVVEGLVGCARSWPGYPLHWKALAFLLPKKS